MGLPPLPFTPIEDDLHIAQPTELLA